MDDNEIIEKHKILDSILHQSDGFLWQDIFRALGSGIVITLGWLNQLLEDIVTKIITLNDFYSTGAVGEFMDKARPLIWVVFFIALIILGFQFMTNKIEKRNEVLLNIIMAVCFIVVIPDLMSNMDEIIDVGIEQMNPEKQTLASNMVKSNVADILYYAEHDFQFSSSTRGDENSPPRPASKEDSSIGTTDYTYANRFSNTSALHVPFMQKLDLHEDDGWLFKEDWVKQLSDDAKEVLSTKSVPTGVGDGYQVEELQKNAVPMTKIGRETYYRYHVNWLPLIVSLLVTSIALGITVIKIGRAIFDLAFHQIFGMFIAASDITGGQRTKKVLVEMLNTFVVIFIMTMLLQLFILFVNWTNGLKAEIGMLGVILLMIAGAWALIDAPDIVQRMLGIDAGLRNGWQAMMGTYAGGKALSAGAGAVKKGLESVGAATVGGANMMKRAVEGVSSETPEELRNKQGSRVAVPEMPGNTNGNDIQKAETQGQIGDLGESLEPLPPFNEAYSNQVAATMQDSEPIPSTISEPASEGINTRAGQVESQQTGIPSQGSHGTNLNSNQLQRGDLSSQMNPSEKGATQSHGDVQSGVISRQESNPIAANGEPSPLSSSSTSQSGNVQQGTIQRQESESIPASGAPIQSSTPGVITPSSTGNGQTRPTPRQESERISTSGVPTRESTPGVTPPLNTESVQQKGPVPPPLSTGNVQTGSTPRQESEPIPPGVTPPLNTESVQQKGPAPAPSSIGNGQTGTSQRQVSEPVPTSGVPNRQDSIIIPSNTSGMTSASQESVTQRPGSGLNSSSGPTSGTNTVRQEARVPVATDAGAVQVNSTPKIERASYGHKQTVHPNTIVGGNPSVQRLREQVTRAGNSGFTLGQNIRRVANSVKPSDKKEKRNNQGSDHK